MSDQELLLLAAIIWGCVFGWVILPRVTAAIRRRNERILREREMRRGHS